MKKLSLLLPLLALAAAPARAEDPATRSPAVSEPHAESAEVAERFPLRHADAHEAAGQIERMAAEDGRGDGFALRVEERTNSLLFSGSDADLEFVRDCVGKVDVPQEQVVLECSFVVVKNGMEDLFGRDWVDRDLRAAFPRDGTSTNAWFASVRVNLDDVARAALRTTNVRMHSYSRCVTRDGRTILLEIADRREWERKFARLAATPTIQTNGTIRLEFLVESLLDDGFGGTNSLAGCAAAAPGDAIVVGGLGADGGGELLAFLCPEIAVPEDRVSTKPATSSESAASAGGKPSDENVQAFLRRLEEPGVIPELELRDAPIDFVAEFLVDASLILNPGTFEERGGVHFTTDAVREDFPKDAVPRVSVRVPDRVSLLQAADLAAEAAGWRRTVYPDKRTVRLGRSRSCGPVSFMADAAPEFAAALERELPAAENPDESARLKSFFAARGVRWSESDEARLLPALGKIVFFVEEPDSARRIRAILAAPGFAPRRIPLRAKVVSFAGDPARFGLGGRDAALAVRALPPEALAEAAAAFEAGAEVAELEPRQAEEGLPATWTLAPTDAAGFAAEATPASAADGEGLRVHFVLRSLPPAADAEAVPPHGCAGDADLAPGEALLVGAIPVAGSPDRSLALLLEFRAESESHAETVKGAEPATP